MLWNAGPMTFGGTTGVRLEGARYAASRAVRAAVVGAGFGGLLAWTLLGTARCEAAQRAHGVDGFACLGGALVGTYVLPVLAFPVGWLLLRLLGVRPAWGVALLGAPFFRAASFLAWSLTGHRGTLPLTGAAAAAVIVGMAGGYAASALLVAPLLRVRYRVAAGAVVLGAAALAFSTFG
ncbi:hypothetical protein [Kitasatospora sp. NPDC094011]|uniref:hypothetical protein n=1 Tax=Kitasatospora sp. NPDC094011 TaxID=3364090 RepID=UPI0038138A0E